jgi:hypothetical protein
VAYALDVERPQGVNAIAILFFAVAAYLGVVGGLMIVSPGTAPMSLGAPLLGGLELAGPYMFLLIGLVTAAIAYGLLRLNNWARRAAILVAIYGVVMLVPPVSSAVVGFQPKALVIGGIGVMLRVVIVWYLFQEPVKEEFFKPHV